MRKATVALISVICLTFLGLVAWSINQKNQREQNIAQYDFNKVIEANEENGQIGDHVKGNPKAKVLIIEYADFQCPGCASMNPTLNQLVESYKNGEVGLIYRNFLLSYHQNANAAAAAVEAAGLQGFWKEYSDAVFANQQTWEGASPSQRGEVFTDLFKRVTKEKGNLEKFKADMVSDRVKKKIDFDMKITKKVNPPETPTIFVNGDKINFKGIPVGDKLLQHLKEQVDRKLTETK